VLKVAIFDDIVFARGETFHIPGMQVDVYGDADQATELCAARGYDLIFMDYAMGSEHQDGATAIRKLRQAGFNGRVVAISSDPHANAAMQTQGADEVLGKKAHLRSYLVSVGARRGGAARAPGEPSGENPGEPSSEPAERE
jgi:CheY-like chemotaxis protein